MALTGASTSVVDMSGDTTGLIIAKGTTAEKNAISSPQAGMIRNNTETDKVEVYNGTDWRNLVEAGNITVLTVDYLLVAGGGAGGTDGGRGGGGGAGGLLTSIGGTPLTLSKGTQYTITVGQGGSASTILNGDDSEMNGADMTLITATGGGRGGGGPISGGNNRSGSDGGSGGGVIAYYTGGNPGTGNTPATTPSQGNNGGSNGGSGQYGAGGGGGAGLAGANGFGHAGGAGGNGVTNSITVASGNGPYYAGGGAGGGTSGNVSGGAGGGGSCGAGSMPYIGHGGDGLIIVQYKVR